MRSSSTPPSAKILLTHFEWTLNQMGEILKNEKSDYFRDASLQRFGFTFDLAIKCIGAFAAETGENCDSPETCINTAVENQWINSKHQWQGMCRDHGLISKTSKCGQAEEIFQNLTGYLVLMKNLYENLARIPSKQP